MRFDQAKGQRPGYLGGHFLVAMPGMMDGRFARSVIYLCAHSSDGAMGFIVNHRAKELRFPEILVQLDIVPEDAVASLAPRLSEIGVVRGGPVEAGRGFVLHSPDVTIEGSTVMVDDRVGLTSTLDILKSIAAGTGPSRAVLALGYAGWGAGQLENEIQRNDWLSCPADPDIVFDVDLATKYDRVMSAIGVDPRMLSPSAGHA